MALPIINGVTRSSYRGLLPSGRQWANVLHWAQNGGGTPSAATIAAVDAILARLYTGTATMTGGVAWLAACNSATTLIDGTHYPLDGASIPTIVNHPATGGTATNTLPSEVAHVVTLRTPLRGRSYRGRTYLPAATVLGITAGGNLTAALQTSTLAQFAGAQSLLQALTPSVSICVASYLHSTYAAVTQFTMDAKPDVQRRRK